MLEQKIADDAKAEKRLKYEDIVGKMTDLQSLAQPVTEGERSAESTSYDRRSRYDEATGKYIEWGANDDWGTQFETTSDGGKILADIKGAGAIVRIWSAQPKTGHVKIFIDGESEPALDMPFINYFGGGFPFNLNSMAYESGRGMNCYVPITYSSSCKVVAYDDWGKYFHIGYISYPESTSVEPFSLPLSANGQRALLETDRRFSGEPGAAADAYDDKTTAEKTVTVPVGGKAELLNASGAGAVVGITARLNGLENEGDDWEALAALAVSAKWDSELTSSVFTTLGGFFGSICGVNEYSGLPLGVKADGTMYADWYMPYSDGALLTLQNDGDRDYSVTYSVSTVSLDKSEADGLLRFHAKWTRLEDPDKSSDRWPDSEFLNIKGTSGRFVGTSLHVYKQIGTGDPDYNPDWWWGEGDEKFFVDSEKFPSWFGTGCEDYFGYAWSSPQTFSKPYNSQPFTNGGMFGIGNRLNNRFHIIDSVPFNESFSANLEKYHRDGYANMVLTSYWYQEKGTTDGYGEASYQQRTEYYESPYPSATLFYEGEDMKIIECSESQKAETQEMSVFGNGWSNSSQLIFKAGQGGYIKLYINAPETADYDLTAVFTKAGDFGIAQHYIDGFKVGNAVDLYNNGVIRSDETTLGSVRLSKGLHVLEVQMNGKNSASSGYYYGLDCLTLTKTE